MIDEEEEDLPVTQYFNICPRPSRDVLTSFYETDEITQQQTSDNSFNGLSRIETDMLMRGWNFNSSAGSFLNFIGGGVVQSRGKWNKLRNPVYVPATYDFLAGRPGSKMLCPEGSFMTNILISPTIGKVAFLGVNCAFPDTGVYGYYRGDC